MYLANESCSDIDNNELDYNENDSDNGDENCKDIIFYSALTSYGLMNNLFKLQL